MGAVESLRQWGANLLPHDTTRTTCPPAPLVCSDGPLIIVPSLMRSGTHLLLDSLFNNFRALRRKPLFMDFDAYERAKLPVEPLAMLRGMTIKTHFPEVEMAEAYSKVLAHVAAKAVVLTPRRPAKEILRSLEKWGMAPPAEEFAKIEARCDAFWAPFAPLKVEFASLLDAAKLNEVLDKIAERTGLKRDGATPVMPSKNRFRVYVDKGLTRLLGRGAPRINTTIGFKLGKR